MSIPTANEMLMSRLMPWQLASATAAGCLVCFVLLWLTGGG